MQSYYNNYKSVMKIVERLINSWIGRERREMERKHSSAEDCFFAIMLDSLRVAVDMSPLSKTVSETQSKWQQKGRAGSATTVITPNNEETP